jgi:hypothetical protein
MMICRGGTHDRTPPDHVRPDDEGSMTALPEIADYEATIRKMMQDAERKAWEALSGYKFWMFGYHAARWVNYNQLLSKPDPNPFRDAVQLARSKV